MFLLFSLPSGSGLSILHASMIMFLCGPDSHDSEDSEQWVADSQREETHQGRDGEERLFGQV